MVRPIRDFLVVNVVKEPETSPGGIIVRPANAQADKITTGKVLSVGSGRLMADGTIAALEVKVGDQVVFNRHLAMEVKNGGEDFYVIREEQVICVLD